MDIKPKNFAIKAALGTFMGVVLYRLAKDTHVQATQKPDELIVDKEKGLGR